MPIECSEEISDLTEDKFREVDYIVTGCAFETQNDLGNLLREQAYKTEIVHRLKQKGLDVQTEVAITARHGHFSRRYLCDIIVEGGIIYEAKAVKALVGKHQEQVLHYLFSSNLSRAKLLNFGSTSLDYRFVSTTLSSEERRACQLNLTEWIDSGHLSDFPSLVGDLIQDWGIGLYRNLYEEALISLYKDLAIRDLPIQTENGILSAQPFPVFTDGTLFHSSTIKKDISGYERNLRKIFRTVQTPAIHWLNIQHHSVDLKTLTQKSF
jgi:GxxExxY protein